ncbi:MAG: GNAT family N-acetyltransferase [Atribacterota bacterium]
MKIRRGTLQDFRKVVRLLRMVFPQDEAGYYWSFLRFDPFFRPEDVWLAEEGREIVSCLWIMRRFFSDGEKTILGGGVANVATHPAFRGQGFASQLLEEALNQTKKEDFSFLTLVTEIPTFYGRFGFVECKKWIGRLEPEGGEGVVLTRAQIREILERYGGFYRKRRLLVLMRTHSYLRGIEHWNRYSARFREGKNGAFWGKNGTMIGYFLPRNQEIQIFDFFFEENPVHVLSFLRKLGKPVQLFHHQDVLDELGIARVLDREVVMVCPLKIFPERLYLPPVDYF